MVSVAKDENGKWMMEIKKATVVIALLALFLSFATGLFNVVSTLKASSQTTHSALKKDIEDKVDAADANIKNSVGELDKKLENERVTNVTQGNDLASMKTSIQNIERDIADIKKAVLKP